MLNQLTQGIQIARSMGITLPRANNASQDNAASTSIKDTVNVSSQVEKNNPYNGISDRAASVKVSPWVKGGDNSNSTLTGILATQGYSQSEIYAKDENGKSLLDKVAATNNLKNPNLIIAGQNLVVPSKGEEDLNQDHITNDSPATGNSGGKFLSGALNRLSELSSKMSQTAASNSVDAPSRDEKSVTKMTDAQAFQAIENDFNWAIDPKEGQPGRRGVSKTNSSVADLNTIALNGPSEAYLENLRGSVNPETKRMYTDSEIQERADRFQQAAGHIAKDETLKTLLENKSNDYAGSFDLKELQDVKNFVSQDNVDALKTIQDGIPALSKVSDYSVFGDEDRDNRKNGVSFTALERVADLKGESAYESWQSGEVQLQDLKGSRKRSEREMGETISKLVEGFPNSQDRLEAIDNLVNATDRVVNDRNSKESLEQLNTWGKGILLDSELETVTGR